MKLCLRLSSCLLLVLFSCSNPYKNLTTDTTTTASALRFKPVFQKELYRCIVDGKFLFKKFHLSGLLLFKKMEDGSTRVVFQNEMGLSFFDFEWDEKNSFKVNQIIPQLDKPAVIKTLQKDLQLLLMMALDASTEQHFKYNELHYNRFDLEKGYAFYISQKDSLYKIENAGKKKVISISVGNKPFLNAMPNAALFKHHKANFTIQLTKIEAHVDE